MTAPTSTPSETPASPRLPPRVRVAFVSIALTALALGLLAIAPSAATDPADGPFLAVFLVVGFALGERFIYHVEARNQAVSYTPSEILLAIGVLYLGPVALVGARLVGATIGSAIWRRSPPFKLVFNLANFATETMVVYTIFHLVAPLDTAVWWRWSSIVVAIGSAVLFGGVMVAVAIAQFEGGLWPRVRAELANSPIFYLAPSVVAASIAIPLLVDPWLAAIAAAPAPVMWYVVRRHGALLHRYGDLVSVHDFSRLVGDAPNVHQLAQAACQRIAEATRAAHVEIRLSSRAGTVSSVVDSGSASIAALNEVGDEDWERLMTRTETLRGPSSELSDLLGDALERLDDPVVAAIRDDRGAVGAVVVADRQGVASRFDDDDIDRLETMLGQLAVAVRKAEFQDQIQHDASHDRLTGLSNRSYFEAWITRALAEDTPAAVFMVDLDRFKQVNDAFGHHVGDSLLTAVADRIRTVCAPDDVAARFGGDEFAVFSSEMTAAEAHLFAENLADALDRPYDLDPATVVMRSSIGIALAPDHAIDLAAIVRRADTAMYDAKRRHTRWSIFSDELHEDDTSRLLLLRDLRQAIEDEDLEVHYQPQIDLGTGRICGAEALVRWTHPEQGRVRPDIFVGLAEQAGLIGHLTRVVLRQAVKEASEWHRRGWDLTLSVNISAQSLHDEQLEPLVAAELQRSRIDPARLRLEVTETSMMTDPERTHRILHGLSGLGVRMSVDDFGTGYSSLANLRHLPVDELKIDRSFVMHMASDRHDEVVVRSTIDLGHNLDLAVVAEGVEDEATLGRLRAMGCDIAQGYFFSRPLPAEMFRDYVGERAESAPDSEGSSASGGTRP